MKKKIIGIFVCTLLIVATFLPVAGTGESNERENNKSSSGTQPLPYWGFHFLPDPNDYPSVPGGCLIVWATENCRKICPALFMGYINRCRLYSGPIPKTITHPDGTVSTVNDIEFQFVWDWHCNNNDYGRAVAPDWDPSTYTWGLWTISDWSFEHLQPGDRLNYIQLADPTGMYPVYALADLNVILENPPIVQDEYFIEDGLCEDLPGFMFGESPFRFDPYAPPPDEGGYPFSTPIPLTGTVYNSGEVVLSPEPIICCPEVEIQTGIGIGVSAIIRNTCNETITDLEWRMVIEGNVFYPPGGEITGLIDSLVPGGETTIKSGLVLGFGPAVITITVDDCDPISADATILGLLVNVRG